MSKNKQTLHYALYVGEKQTYKLDADGNPIVIYRDGDKVFYQKSGDKKKTYSETVEFLGNIVMSNGETNVTEFGVSISDYAAILIVPKNLLPITETSLIWFQTTPINHTVVEDGEDVTYADDNTADYRVKKVSTSLNYDKYLLERIVKS